jgi:hypothetical protein
VVLKKGEPKPGGERKTTNRCNRYTAVDNHDMYEISDDIDD